MQLDREYGRQKTMRRHLSSLRPAVAVAILALAFDASGQGSLTPEYRIGPRDLLEIKVFEVAELNIDRRVSDEGSINLPLIGDVPVTGLTEAELADRLKALLESRYVQRASVSVFIKEFRSRPITVLGAVRQPGELKFSGRWTLLEAISAAGGLADNRGDTIYVLRRASNGLSDQIAIRVDDLIINANPDANIPIFSNDIINIPARVDVTIFCLGAVRSPGALNFLSTQRITLLSAVARAGGLTDRASKKLTIKRRDRSGVDVELVADFKRILAGKAPDIELMDGDVVVVKESFF